MIRTFPLGTTGPRRQPTLLGFIRQVEARIEDRDASPAAPPGPAAQRPARLTSPTRKKPGRRPGFFAVSSKRQEARQSAAVTDSFPITER